MSEARTTENDGRNEGIKGGGKDVGMLVECSLHLLVNRPSSAVYANGQVDLPCFVRVVKPCGDLLGLSLLTATARFMTGCRKSRGAINGRMDG